MIFEWNIEVQQGEESWEQELRAEITCTKAERQKQSRVIQYHRKFM